MNTFEKTKLKYLPIALYPTDKAACRHLCITSFPCILKVPTEMKSS